MIKTTLRLATILLIVCAIAAAAVSIARDTTLPLIEKRHTEAVLNGYQQVLPTLGSLSKEAYTDKQILEIEKSTLNGETNGYIYTVKTTGYSGNILIMLGIEHPTARISGVKILQQSETPGLGSKCAEPDFVQQFLNKTTSVDLKVSKNATKPEEIQAITASTITSKAVTNGINVARKHYQEQLSKLVEKGA